MKTTDRLILTKLISLKLEGILSDELSEFEREIRKDENKITRHACAKAVLEIGKRSIDGTQFDTGVREALKSAHQVIMNVNAIKKEG